MIEQDFENLMTKFLEERLKVEVSVDYDGCDSKFIKVELFLKNPSTGERKEIYADVDYIG